MNVLVIVVLTGIIGRCCANVLQNTHEIAVRGLHPACRLRNVRSDVSFSGGPSLFGPVLKRLGVILIMLDSMRNQQVFPFPHERLDTTDSSCS